MTTKELTLNELNENNLPVKNKTTIRTNGSRRVTLDVSEPQITDQSQAKATDINNILKQYSSQGVMPSPITDPSFYRDNTAIPNIMDAFNIVNRASEAFSELPADIRKLMDNDPSNLESFILDPENTELLIKRGVLAKPEVKTPVDVPAPNKPGDVPQTKLKDS